MYFYTFPSIAGMWIVKVRPMREALGADLGDFFSQMSLYHCRSRCIVVITIVPVYFNRRKWNVNKNLLIGIEHIRNGSDFKEQTESSSLLLSLLCLLMWEWWVCLLLRVWYVKCHESSFWCELMRYKYNWIELNWIINISFLLLGDFTCKFAFIYIYIFSTPPVWGFNFYCAIWNHTLWTLCIQWKLTTLE